MSNDRGSTGDARQDMDGRELLVEECLAELFATYDRGRNDGIRDPVIFLIDCEDGIGEPIARAWEGDDVVDGALLAYADHGDVNERRGVVNEDHNAETGWASTTILTRAFSFEDSRQEIPELFPYLAGSFEAPPPKDGFLVVVIAFGGAGTFTVPLDVRPDVRPDE